MNNTLTYVPELAVTDEDGDRLTAWRDEALCGEVVMVTNYCSDTGAGNSVYLTPADATALADYLYAWIKGEA